MIKKFLNILFFVFLLVQNTVLAENFYINNYDVDIKVDENKVVDITENIDVYFTNPSHGIFRSIPYSGGKIEDISVSEDYSIEYDGGNIKIKIGNPEKLVKKNHHYAIKYKHILKDKKKEFYYNIIGTNWNVPIEKASFNVEMPKPFNHDKAGISIGKYGTRGFDGDAVFSIKDTKIQGQTKRTLNPNEGITLRIPLSKHYFSYSENKTGGLVVAIMLGLTLFCFLVWYAIGRDEQVIPVVNFYPPEKYSSAEAEVIYKGNLSEKGLASLFVWLANKGYLKINDKSEDYTIEKIKDYDGANKNIAEFMSALFPEGTITFGKSLEYSEVFYIECKEITKNFDKVRNVIFYKDSISWQYILLLSLCIIALIVLELSLAVDFDFNTFMNSNPVALFILIGIICSSPKDFTKMIFAGVFVLILSFAGTFDVLFDCIANNGNGLNLAIGMICLIVSVVCLYQLPKRSKIGNKELGRLLGFRKFLETVEVKRVETLVKENPNYCFDILPYLYIFDLSDEWIKKFEKFFRTPPSWYSGPYFANNFVHLTNNMGSVTQPSTANGGISSSSGGGGGFSGGGCGGGGGGSW